jgi:NAD(P)-dependent dehydrogenase (short-subunit alcohol dehydrogenase family)
VGLAAHRSIDQGQTGRAQRNPARRLVTTSIEVNAGLCHLSFAARPRRVHLGGSSGIGAELVRAFAAQGAHVAFCGTKSDRRRPADPRKSFATAIRSLGIERAMSATPTLISSSRPRAAAELGAIRVLVNNAGRDDRHAMEDVTPQMWDDRIAPQPKHYFFAIQAVAPGHGRRGRRRRDQHGIGELDARPPQSRRLHDGEGRHPRPHADTRARARARNMRVNASRAWRDRDRAAAKLHRDATADQQFLDAQCLKVRLDPGHVARAELFLAADDSDGMTGQHMLVDAGIAQVSVHHLGAEHLKCARPISALASAAGSFPPSH